MILIRAYRQRKADRFNATPIAGSVSDVAAPRDN
jgi:hypothetical protein